MATILLLIFQGFYLNRLSHAPENESRYRLMEYFHHHGDFEGAGRMQALIGAKKEIPAGLQIMEGYGNSLGFKS